MEKRTSNSLMSDGDDVMNFLRPVEDFTFSSMMVGFLTRPSIGRHKSHKETRV